MDSISQKISAKATQKPQGLFCYHGMRVHLILQCYRRKRACKYLLSDVNGKLSTEATADQSKKRSRFKMQNYFRSSNGFLPVTESHRASIAGLFTAAWLSATLSLPGKILFSFNYSTEEAHVLLSRHAFCTATKALIPLSLEALDWTSWQHPSVTSSDSFQQQVLDSSLFI